MKTISKLEVLQELKAKKEEVLNYINKINADEAIEKDSGHYRETMIKCLNQIDKIDFALRYVNTVGTTDYMDDLLNCQKQ